MNLEEWQKKTCRPGGCSACKAVRSTLPVHVAMRVSAFGSDACPCLYGPAPIPVVETRTAASITNPKNWTAFIKALMTRPKLTAEGQAERQAACNSPCDYLQKDERGSYCGVPGGCGCRTDPLKVAWMDLGMVDITLYGEPVGKALLCQHPERGTPGKGWPLPAWALEAKEKAKAASDAAALRKAGEAAGPAT